MPSNTQRIVAAIATAGLFIGGAWFAAGFRSDIAETSASTSGNASELGLVVNLHGARSDNGKLVVMAFDNAAAFDAMDYQRAAGYVELPAKSEPQRVDFPDLRNGYYSVIAFHDENSDYELNTFDGFLPSEGYAVSGLNSLYELPNHNYSLVAPGRVVDLGLFYWPEWMVLTN